MHTRILLFTFAAALLAPAFSAVAADNVPPPPEQVQMQATGGYLGVLVQPVPEALRAQLGETLPNGQGVMVRDVEADSPASRAGLKPFDILTLYDDQKLYSAEQLTRLVRADRPDANVSLNVVRAGATDKIQVTLGAVPATPEFGFPGPFGGMDMPMHRHHAPRYATPPGSDESGWETFDSMSIKKLKDGTFKADIQFLDKDGNLEKQEFTGTRKAIRSELLERKDIPAAERHQLLDALNARGRFMPPERWFGPRFFPPWFDWQPDF